MIDIEQAHEEWVLMEEPMGSFQTFIFAEYQKTLAEVKRLRMYEVAWKMLYDNAIEEGRETRTRTWKEIMELVRCDVREMVDTGDAVFDEWAKRTIGGFE